MLNNQLIQYRVLNLYRNNNKNCNVYINNVYCILLIDDNKNISVKKIAFLKLNNIYISLYLFEYITLC